MPKITNVHVKSVKLSADLKLTADEAQSLGLLTTADVGDLQLQITGADAGPLRPDLDLLNEPAAVTEQADRDNDHRKNGYQ